ncbi:hypothetical protein G9272_24595 [Streptomyces asoensis]|uniref:Type I restriction modification DNA specificity domain-containing protein n=1 Tax=Streptomyces asoensis TaxID=249586 RepID=A0A6M4WT05_9ACTN|nr:hypothetical protein [Streptomyces asoensis]QJT03072.1 hypothetical protein G9272_24595 [Streptomyces asoensis]
MHDHVGSGITGSDLDDVWTSTTVAEAAEDMRITYGISDRDLPDHQGVVRIGDIRDGRVRTDQPGRTGAAEPKDTRAALRAGDLVVVLVRRAGDAALVTEEHAGWIATRGVGIIRSEDSHVTRWLRIWFRTPRAQAWIGQHVDAHVEPTLSLDALRRMPVLLPPPARIDRLDDVVGLIEARMELNLRIAADAVQLADAQHAALARHRAWWPLRPFGAVTRAATGRAAPKAAGEDDGPRVTRVAPGDILDARLPYIAATGQEGPAEPRTVCDSGTILIATRPGGGHAAVTLRPTAPGRGVVAIHPQAPTDLWWLLHELRSRGEELSGAAQGRHAREITARAFSKLDVAWPDEDTRRRFDRVAEPLHGRARKAVEENRVLRELLGTLLRGLSSGSGRVSLGGPGAP